MCVLQFLDPRPCSGRPWSPLSIKLSRLRLNKVLSSENPGAESVLLMKSLILTWSSVSAEYSTASQILMAFVQGSHHQTRGKPQVHSLSCQPKAKNWRVLTTCLRLTVPGHFTRGRCAVSLLALCPL